MKNLIIDATNKEVFFSIITESQSYTTSHTNCRENFDKFMDLLLIFLKKNNLSIKDIEEIFINQGPGKTSSIRNSISMAKAIALSNKIKLFGFNTGDLIDRNYNKLLKLKKKKLLNKYLLKSHYSS
tara:strand:+ start:169 stop:546 length:378 start_codon:yes stop_codon:yes gene_type:complete